MLHYCEYCEFNSKHKWVVKRHREKKHTILTNYAPATISEQQNVTQTPSDIIQYGSGAEVIQPLTSHYQSTSTQMVQDNSPFNTISIEDYNKVVEYAHAWKDICGKLHQEKCADGS